jgi:LacI family transcriptional regulator
MVDALKAAGRAADMLVVGHEVNPVTAPLLRSGAMDFAIAGVPSDLLGAALRMATGTDLSPGKDVRHLDFGVYTRFNMPSFATSV